MLWIAFRLYLWFIEHSYIVHVGILFGGCELLSDCIFDLLNTADDNYPPVSSLLWIAFRLYLWFIEHSRWQLSTCKLFVVNCFQIVSLIYWTQQATGGDVDANSCELLSDCIFDLLNTANTKRVIMFPRLWIAFRLYLWFIEHSLLIKQANNVLVVNCFQIVSLIYWTQPREATSSTRSGCELLSDCIFDLLNTALW